MKFTPIMEDWRRIPSYPHYEASDLGRIRRAADAPRLGRGKPGAMLATRRHRQGYRVIRMCTGRPVRQRTRLVHSLVTEAFLGPIPAGLEVNHKDGFKMNNDVRNLEYVTHSENVLHAVRTGLANAKRGCDSAKSKLNELQVRIIRRSLSLGVFQSFLGELFGVSQQTIGNLKGGHTYVGI